MGAGLVVSGFSEHQGSHQNIRVLISTVLGEIAGQSRSAAIMALAAEAEAALRELAAVLSKAETMLPLAALRVLGELACTDEHDELEAEVREDIAAMLAKAAGDAGDPVKYKAAVEQWVRRWHVFTALYDLAENVEPTDELAQLFTGFMYKNRQRSSRSGRQGLGDSMAEMAQHILAQVCCVRARTRARALQSPTARGRKRGWEAS